MRKAILRGVAIALAMMGASRTLAQGADTPPPSVPTVETIAGIGPVGEWRRLGTGYLLSEGPAPAPDGTLYFTDYRGGGIFRIDPETDAISQLIGTNLHAGGLAVDAEGRIVAAETRQGKILRIDPATRAITVLADGIDGTRFNAPNDLAIDAEGGIYFTDPSNGATLPLAQGKQSVYYVDPAGKVTRVVDYLPHPNGIALSPDGASLYVALTSESEVLGYHVEGPGALSPASFVFGRVAFTPPTRRGEGAYTGVDGMAVDAAGNVYTASRFGIEVIDPQGRSLGTIATPERPSNLKFGGRDGRTLYVTTYTSIYAVPMATAGVTRR